MILLSRSFPMADNPPATRIRQACLLPHCTVILNVGKDLRLHFAMPEQCYFRIGTG